MGRAFSPCCKWPWFPGASMKRSCQRNLGNVVPFRFVQVWYVSRLRRYGSRLGCIRDNFCRGNGPVTYQHGAKPDGFGSINSFRAESPFHRPPQTHRKVLVILISGGEVTTPIPIAAQQSDSPALLWLSDAIQGTQHHQPNDNGGKQGSRTAEIESEFKPSGLVTTLGAHAAIDAHGLITCGTGFGALGRHRLLSST